MAGARQAVMATDIKAYQAEAKRIVDDARKMYNGEPLKYSDFSKDVMIVSSYTTLLCALIA